MPRLPPLRGDTPIPRNLSLVNISEAKSARELAAVLARKPDERMSDEAWAKLHHVGELAVDKLEELITDKGFNDRSLNEKLKIIDMALNRAYGNVEVGAKRPLPKKQDNNTSAGGNTLSRLAQAAKYPELKGHPSPDVSDDNADD